LPARGGPGPTAEHDGCNYRALESVQSQIDRLTRELKEARDAEARELQQLRTERDDAQKSLACALDALDQLSVWAANARASGQSDAEIIAAMTCLADGFSDDPRDYIRLNKEKPADTEADAANRMQRIARCVDLMIPAGWAFIVLTFPYMQVTTHRRAQYISNARREDMVRAMSEWIENNQFIIRGV
jgi:hypothetical protein